MKKLIVVMTILSSLAISTQARIITNDRNVSNGTTVIPGSNDGNGGDINGRDTNTPGSTITTPGDRENRPGRVVPPSNNNNDNNGRGNSGRPRETPGTIINTPGSTRDNPGTTIPSLIPKINIRARGYANFYEADAVGGKTIDFPVWLIFKGKLVNAQEDLTIHYTIRPRGRNNGFEVGQDIVTPTYSTTIKRGSHRGVISLEVINDTLLERKYEGFEIIISNPDSDKYFLTNNGISRGGILDDEFAGMHATDNGDYSVLEHGVADSKKIMTKIISKPFTLDIVAKDNYKRFIKRDSTDVNKTLSAQDCEQIYGRGHTECVERLKHLVEIYDNAMNIDKIVLHTFQEYNQTNDKCQKERPTMLLAKELSIESGDSSSVDVNTSKATPCAYIEVIGRSARDENGTRDRLSGLSDKFAIRPLKFVLPKGIIAKAGKDENISIFAVDNGGVIPGSDYNETGGISYELNVSNSNRHCGFDTGDLNISELTHFGDGVLSGRMIYEDVGDLNITIREIVDSEFAKVDANDTKDPQRYIQSDSAVIKFVPFGFNANVDFNNTQIDQGAIANPYAFYSRDLDNGPRWKFTVAAVNESNETLDNYNDQCMNNSIVKNVDLNLSFSILSDNDSTHIYHDLNGSINEVPFADPFKLSIKLPEFNNSIASKSVGINLGRQMLHEKAPANISLTRVDIEDEFGGTFSQTTNLKPTNGVTYQYMRAFIRPSVTVIDENVLRTDVHYETYMPSTATVAAASTPNSRSVSGERNWKKVNKISSKMNFSNLTAKYIDPNRSQPFNENNRTLRVTTINVPERNTIIMDVEQDFQYLTPQIHTDVAFLPDGSKWVGRGKIGRTVDINRSKQSIHKKIGW